MSPRARPVVGLVVLAVLLVLAALAERARGGLELGLVALAFLLAAPASRLWLAARGRGRSLERAPLGAAGLALLLALVLYPCPAWALLLAGAAVLAIAFGRPASSALASRADLGLLLLLAAAASLAGLHALRARSDPLTLLLLAAVVAELGLALRRTAADVARAAASIGVLGAAALLEVNEAWNEGASVRDFLRAVALVAAVATGARAARGPSARTLVVSLALAVAMIFEATRGTALALLAVALAAAFPAVVAETWEPWRALAARWRRAVVAAGLVLGAAFLVAFLVARRSHLGGVDFFFYLLFARDLTVDPASTPLLRYVYCPGVYTFWRSALALGGASLATAQATYAAVLVLGFGLVGLIVARATRSLAAGGFAALWVAVLAFRFEGDEGVVEPLAVLPALAGVAVWGGAPLRGRAGLLRALALGAGLGLAVYVKQQGLLLSAGAVTLLAGLRGGEDEKHTWGCLIAGAVAVALAFAVPVALEGEGLEPIRWAFFHARVYPATGTFQGHLLAVATHEPPLVLALLTGLVAAVVGLARPRGDARETSLVLFSTAAALACAVQLTKRGYHHYVLLAVPFATIAGVLGARLLAARLPVDLRAGPLARALPLCLGLLLLARRDARDPGFRAWPFPGPTPPQRWHERADVLQDLDLVRRHVRPGDELILIPPRQQAASFLLGTRTRASPMAYAWPPELGYTYDDVRWDAVRAVLVVPEDQDLLDPLRGREALASLPRRGFRPVLERPTLTLWRRD